MSSWNEARGGRVRAIAVAVLMASMAVVWTGCGGKSKTTSGTINTVAGTVITGSTGDGGPATSASLSNPVSVAIDGSGNLFIADTQNNKIRKVSSSGTISTLAGTGTPGFGGDGGPATSALLNAPRGVAVDSSGNVYIADTLNARIRKVSTSGTITTYAGSGISGFAGDGGPAVNAQLSSVQGLAVDGSGNLYIADRGNARIRLVTASTGVITTIAGNGTPGFAGDGSSATSAQLNLPSSIAVDGSGNLYIADTQNQRIRKVAGGQISTVAGDGTGGSGGDGGPATAAEFSSPQGVALDGSGNLYVADTANNRVRKIVLGGNITTVAGSTTAGFSGDGGPSADAQLIQPDGVAFGGSALYIADTGNSRIRKVTF